MKKTFVWTAILFFLTSVIVPTAVMADGNPKCGRQSCPAADSNGGN